MSAYAARIATLPASYYEPPDELPEVPEFAIDEQLDAYCKNPGDLADLLSQNHPLLIAVCTHMLADCDGIETHIERMIRADPAAMERVVREAEESLRRAV